MKNNNKYPADDLTRLSLVNNLKHKIQVLKSQVQHQKAIIEGYKKSTKITLINQQEIQIQKLNDENKRLLLIIQDLKSQCPPSRGIKDIKNKVRASMITYSTSKKKQQNNSDKKLQPQTTFQPQQNKYEQKQKQKKIEYKTKYYQILNENDKMRKQLIILKANQNSIKNKKPLNQRSSVLIQNNINQIDKIRQKGYQVQAELVIQKNKNRQLKNRVNQLEEMLEKAMQINKSMKII